MKNCYLTVKNMVRCKMDGFNNEEYWKRGIKKEIVMEMETGEVGCRIYSLKHAGEFHPCKECKKEKIK